ncbi:biotin-dependent carboxyltransferase family protein [Blastomonas sp. UPD001]|uniref:5-oxoprolinase subunit C family protein n=1 Tax=Blastomonas sp. UPD001 TaxID=2217673 RepID=UPI000E34F333|nr:biotin-dependent carboxyltransferase family protein [Blastomonas sp. UPD001]MBL0965928.1 biotin-dependent carboxyltransferase family protein [Blastomonas sp.]
MNLTVVKAGLQSSIQAAPFRGLRKLAVPSGGAADGLSLALANRLVGRPLDAAAIEIALGPAEFRADRAMAVAVTGAPCQVQINGEEAEPHQTLHLEPGDVLAIGRVWAGCRVYLALSAAIEVPEVLGTRSTLIGAGFGGLEGRALADGDVLALGEDGDAVPALVTPPELQPFFGHGFVLRVVAGPESDRLALGMAALARKRWRVSSRSSRMGLKLQGTPLDLNSAAPIRSGAVFPGIIQCPPDGLPYLIGCEGQTTGGYPRIGQVIRADRHLIGQLAPNATMLLVPVQPDQAEQILHEKLKLWAEWLPGLALA